MEIIDVGALHWAQSMLSTGRECHWGSAGAWQNQEEQRPTLWSVSPELTSGLFIAAEQIFGSNRVEVCLKLLFLSKCMCLKVR